MEEPSRPTNPNFVRAVGAMLALFFALGVILGRLLRFLLRFSSPVGVFFASWAAQDSILKGLGAIKLRFGKPKRVFFRCFFVPLRYSAEML